MYFHKVFLPPELLEDIEQNMEVNECSDRSGFIEIAQTIYDDYADEIGQDLIDSVMAKIADT